MEDIERIRTQTGPNKFASQMMLQPVNIAEGRLDPALLCRYGDRLVYKEVQKSASLHLGARKLVSCSAWWDPSFGSAGGDGSVLAVVYTDEEGNTGCTGLNISGAIRTLRQMRPHSNAKKWQGSSKVCSRLLSWWK